jgi:hypothetical protein
MAVIMVRPVNMELVMLRPVNVTLMMARLVNATLMMVHPIICDVSTLPPNPHNPPIKATP